jgi:hypothetical protein
MAFPLPFPKHALNGRFQDVSSARVQEGVAGALRDKKSKLGEVFFGFTCYASHEF